MSPAVLATMTDSELLADVTRELCAMEDQAARLQLAKDHLPITDEAVHRLTFARWLVVSLRLREHAIGAAVA